MHILESNQTAKFSVCSGVCYTLMYFFFLLELFNYHFYSTSPYLMMGKEKYIRVPVPP